MRQKKMPVWGFFIGSAGFLLATVVRFFQGEEFKAVFLVLAIVFAMLGIIVARRNRGDGTPPPAA